MKCLEIARLKDFTPNNPGLLGVAQGPQTPCRKGRDSRYVSTNPPLEIPVYGPENDSIYLENYGTFIYYGKKLVLYMEKKLWYYSKL